MDGFRVCLGSHIDRSRNPGLVLRTSLAYSTSGDILLLARAFLFLISYKLLALTSLRRRRVLLLRPR
jgi:hypothetical protein